MALPTERGRHRDRRRDANRGHPSMPLQGMSSFLLGFEWLGVYEKSCVCLCSGQQV